MLLISRAWWEELRSTARAAVGNSSIFHEAPLGKAPHLFGNATAYSRATCEAQLVGSLRVVSGMGGLLELERGTLC